MRKGLLFLATILVVTLPLCLAAEDGRRCDGPRPDARPPRPNPEVMFQRLDANQDGVITPDELPEGMPERLKQLLIRADENKDQRLTKDELIRAFKAPRACPPRPEAGPRPPKQPKQVPGKKAPHKPPVRHGVAMQKPPVQGMFKGWPGMRVAQPMLFDAKAIFNRLDKDKDGKLSFEEFAAGLHQFRQMIAMRAGQWAPKMQFPKGTFAWAPKMLAFKAPSFKQGCPEKMVKQSPMARFCPMCCPCCSFAKQGMPGKQMPGKQWFDYRGPQPSYRPQWMMVAHHWQPQMVPRWGGWQAGPMGFGPWGFTPWMHKDGKEQAFKAPERFKTPQFETPQHLWWGEPPKQLGKKPQQPRLEVKPPERRPEKPELKEESGKIKEIEARLTALEKQQAMLLAAVREVRMLLTEAQQDKGPRETAKVPPKPKHRQWLPEERD